MFNFVMKNQNRRHSKYMMAKYLTNVCTVFKE